MLVQDMRPTKLQIWASKFDYNRTNFTFSKPRYHNIYPNVVCITFSSVASCLPRCQQLNEISVIVLIFIVMTCLNNSWTRIRCRWNGHESE